MKTNNKIYKGHIAILVANITFGLMSPMSKSVLNAGYFSPYSLTMMRMAGAAAAFWIASIFTKKEEVPTKDLVLLFFASLLGVVINQFCFIKGVSLTSPIDASIVTTTTPIITMILAALYLKEPITSKKIIGILIGASGALLLILNGNHTNTTGENKLAGNLLCLLAQISFATYYVVFKNLICKYSPITLMKWMFLYATICCIPFTYGDLMLIPFKSLSINIWFELLFIVFGATFVAYLLIPVAQQILRPTVVSMYNYVQPLIASLVAVWIGMDTFGVIKGIAVILVFTGVYFVTQSKSKAQMDAEKQAKQSLSSQNKLK